MSAGNRATQGACRAPDRRTHQWRPTRNSSDTRAACRPEQAPGGRPVASIVATSGEAGDQGEGYQATRA
jgi:hypothetical protein